MKLLRWLLPFIVVIVLFILFFTLWMPTLPLSAPLSERGTFGDSFGVLSSLFSGLGFAAVVVTIWLQQRQIEHQVQESNAEVKEKRSLFNLESCLEAYKQARLLLADHNNDRATWIRAGRLLGHAKVLGEGVTIDAHQRVLEFSRLEYRTFFSELLETKAGSFFYGVALDQPTIDDAACAATAPEDRNGRRNISTNHLLSEASIYAVWEAAQWPSDYIDPLDTTFTIKERNRLIIHYLGLYEFLEHKNQWRSASGVLSKRNTKNVT